MMNRRKGHNYVTVFADLVGKRVLFGVEGKDASVWEAFAQELGAHNGHPKAITQVAINMSPAYQKEVREHLVNAALVFDKMQSPWLSYHQKPIRHALLRGRKAPYPMPPIRLKMSMERKS